MAGSARANHLMNVRRLGGKLSTISSPFFQIAQILRKRSLVGLYLPRGIASGSPELHDGWNCAVGSNRFADRLREIRGKNICNPDGTPRLIRLSRIALEQFRRRIYQRFSFTDTFVK